MAAKKRKAADTTAAAPPSPRRTRGSTSRKVSVQKQEPSKKSKPSKEAPKPQQETDSRTIVIEACKQCNSFKTRASKVKEGLENGIPGIIVTINPDKPRKGCFEVRNGSGKTFISLLNMPRPFKKMKELDMDKVIEDIIKKLND